MTQGERLKRLYYSTLRIRLVEERIAQKYSEQEMRCPVHLSIGQEGVATGVAAALKKSDAVMSGHRSHGHYLAKGGDLRKMMAEIYGRATGCSFGRGGSMHLIDLSVNFLGATPIVASTIPVATGVAWAMKMKKQKNVVVAFLGEGATEEGVWHESLNFAVLHQLPIIYVCENNLYSVYTSLAERQPPRRSLAELAQAYGAQVFTGDGNKAWEVQAVAEKAVAKARGGNGPFFLESSTYRWREHCGPNYDNDIGYRTEGEFKRWQKQDPLRQLEQLVLTKRVHAPESIVRLTKKINQEIDEAFQFAKDSPFPAANVLFEPGVYAT